MSSWHNKQIIEDFATVFALFVVILTMIALTSCHPVRVIAEANYDSVWVHLRERITWELDSVPFKVPLQKATQTLRGDSSYLSNDFAWSVAMILNDGSLYHSLETRPRLWFTPFRRPVLTRDSIVYRNFYSTNTVEVPAELTKMQRFAITGFWSIVGAAGLVLAFYLLKLWKKINPF